MMPIGYENPNGNQSKVAPVMSLTNDEQVLQMAAARLANIVSEGEQAAHRLKTLLSTCSHRVFNDMPGDPYDIRRCLICCAYLGLV